jgi:D-beta-D-heptose 7-phosphate kinase/D-beta-D-heptose 1-phosphate adenosyltransferase
MINFDGRRILVVGDLMLDEFIWGKVSRISPEAPVPVVNVTGESYYPGGAANVARNVREFTSETAAMGIAGCDPAGTRLLDLMRASGIDISGVQQDPGCSTILKTRIIARNQQVVRVDRERKAPLTAEQSARALAFLESAVPAVDAIIAADYGKGFLTQILADHISRLAREHGKILTVDPHPHTSLNWRGATAIKPNRAEAFAAAGLPPTEDHPLPEVARRLFERWDCRCLLITLGEEGMILFQQGAEPHRIPARVQDVFDVSGAGDTAIAVLTVALAAGAMPVEAAELANRASGIVVGKLGTATVSADELRRFL